VYLQQTVAQTKQQFTLTQSSTAANAASIDSVASCISVNTQW